MSGTAYRRTRPCGGGEAGYVGGQEDVITDVALRLVAERERGAVRV
ncbi:hypothetical protein [Streptomyces atratus]|nr:hypothetical protein [Streptomyces atratus]